MPLRGHCLKYSIWESVPGEEKDRPRLQQVVCYESAEEGDHCTEGKDDRTYDDRETSTGGCQRVPFPRDSSLRVSNGCQTSPHLGYVVM